MAFPTEQEIHLKAKHFVDTSFKSTTNSPICFALKEQFPAYIFEDLMAEIRVVIPQVGMMLYSSYYTYNMYMSDLIIARESDNPDCLINSIAIKFLCTVKREQDKFVFLSTKIMYDPE